jgi:hypothetical protein
VADPDEDDDPFEKTLIIRPGASIPDLPARRQPADEGSTTDLGARAKHAAASRGASSRPLSRPAPTGPGVGLVLVLVIGVVALVAAVAFLL